MEGAAGANVAANAATAGVKKMLDKTAEHGIIIHGEPDSGAVYFRAANGNTKRQYRATGIEYVFGLTVPYSGRKDPNRSRPLVRQTDGSLEYGTVCF